MEVAVVTIAVVLAHAYQLTSHSCHSTSPSRAREAPSNSQTPYPRHGRQINFHFSQSLVPLPPAHGLPPLMTAGRLGKEQQCRRRLGEKAIKTIHTRDMPSQQTARASSPAAAMKSASVSSALVSSRLLISHPSERQRHLDLTLIITITHAHFRRIHTCVCMCARIE